MSAIDDRPHQGPRLSLWELHQRLLVTSLAYFFGHLRDVQGDLFEVPRHIEYWCQLFMTYPRLVLAAPRDHGKSTLGLVYLLWRIYVHEHDPMTGAHREIAEGTFSAVLMSATREAAGVLMERFRALLDANDDLFPRTPGRQDGTARRVRNSTTLVRRASGAELMIRVFRTGTRGLHPTVLLLDDVVSDRNSGNQHQRNLTWQHFTGTLLPMHAERVIIIGTAYHYDDLLHRLEPRVADRDRDD